MFIHMKKVYNEGMYNKIIACNKYKFPKQKKSVDRDRRVRKTLIIRKIAQKPYPKRTG